MQKAEDRMKNGGLASTIRADQTERLAFADGKVDPMKDLHLAIASTQFFELKKRLTLDQSRKFGPW